MNQILNMCRASSESVLTLLLLRRLACYACVVIMSRLSRMTLRYWDFLQDLCHTFLKETDEATAGSSGFFSWPNAAAKPWLHRNLRSLRKRFYA